MADFWIEMMGEYPDLSKCAVKVLVPFSTTYLCHPGFSIWTRIQNKYSDRLNAEHDMRLKLSVLLPDINDVRSLRPAHPSYCEVMTCTFPEQ